MWSSIDISIIPSDIGCVADSFASGLVSASSGTLPSIPRGVVKETTTSHYKSQQESLLLATYSSEEPWPISVQIPSVFLNECV